MIATSISDYERLKKFRANHLVRIFFDRKHTAVFYLSDKQYDKLVDTFVKVHYSKLKKTYVIAVFDNIEERYVWCGIEYLDYSDRDFLLKNFNAEWSNDYHIDDTPVISHHIPKKIELNEIEPIKKLRR